MSEKVLRLKSIAGAAAMEYSWPLTVGAGNLRGAEDEHDQACEIVESIKWVGSDWPEVAEAMGSLLDSYNRHAWESMSKIVDTYNNAVNDMVTSNKHKDRLNKRTSRQMLRHIIQQVYNRAICDPNELNHYEPFTPEVYGETSFELINQMIDQISPIGEDNKFLDLGSGVGQVVLQVAALTDCSLCVGIEKAIIPSGRAVEMDSLFRRWMAWYGKKYSPYTLHQGDFLTPEHRKTISESTIVFVNNYAFGPNVDHMLKDRFADLKDGARIVSSKPFCPLNFRITERNLSDIGTIMHVSVMDPLQGSVSWTDKPVSYYLHIIDSTKLERYYNRKNSTTRTRRTGHNLLDMDSASNGSASRASSLEKELDSPLTHLSTASGDESDPPSKGRGQDDDSDVGSKGRPRGRGRSKKKLTKKKSTPRVTDPQVATVTNFLNHLEGSLEDMETTPDTSVPTSRGETPPISEDASEAAGGSGRERPLRAAVVNAAAITEAQNDILSSLGRRSSKMRGRGKYKHLNEGDRLPRPQKTGTKKMIAKRPSPPTSVISEMDLLHQETMNKITECNDTDELPTGCTNEALNILPPDSIYHQEVPFHVHAGEEKIPHGLHILLETMKKQYLSMIETMQSKEYSKNIKHEIDKEKDRRENLTKRVKQLENQIDSLIQDSLGLLKARMRELGIAATTPTSFTEQAKDIVCSHTDLLKKKGGLETEIRRLELEQEQMVQAKEKELFEQLLSQKSGNDVNVTELKQYVQREIRSCFDLRAAPLPKLSSDVTLTKVAAPERLQEKEKESTPGLGLPKMEIKLSGESPFSLLRSDERVNGHAERSADSRSRSADPSTELVDRKVSAPKASDDYEDRVKMIIHAELAKEKKDAEKHTSPSKEQKPLIEQQRTLIEQQRALLEQQRRPQPRPPQRPPQPPLEHQRPPIDHQRPPLDPRMDPRMIQDPRIDQRIQDPRIDQRVQDSRMPDPRDHRIPDRHPDSRMDRHGPGMDRQGPGMERQGPGMDRQGPGMDRLGPGMDRQGPGMDRQGPGMDRQGPGMDRQGPGMDRQGPVMDRQGLGMDRQGPVMDRQGPGIDRLGSDPRLQALQDARNMQDMRLLHDPRGAPISPHEQPRRNDSRGSNRPDGRFGDRPPFPDSSRPFPDSSRAPPFSEAPRGYSGGGGVVSSSGSEGSTHPTLTSLQVINMSVEKAMQNQSMPTKIPSGGNNSVSVGAVIATSSGQAVTQNSRMSLIIEESVRREAEKDQRRNVYSAVVNKGDIMEGLACPRGPTSTQDRKPVSGTSGLPQVEGLAARFGSYFEKESKEKSVPRTSGEGPGARLEALGPRGEGLGPRGEGLGARFSSPDMVQSRPTSTGSKSSLHTPDPSQQDLSADKKRAGSPLLSPPGGKKQNLDDEGKKWQDEISMGFDRLVAMASEVDKGRKSAENSPAHNSPRKSEGSKDSPRNPPSSDLRLPQESMQFDTLSMKIKAGLMQGASLSPIPRGDQGPSSRGVGDRNLPGENLPEHHFKKKYFNQEYQRQQEETMRASKGDPRGPPEGARGGEVPRGDYHRGYDQERWTEDHRNINHQQRVQVERQRMEQKQLHDQRAYYEAARDPRIMGQSPSDGGRGGQVGPHGPRDGGHDARGGRQMYQQGSGYAQQREYDSRGAPRPDQGGHHGPPVGQGAHPGGQGPGGHPGGPSSHPGGPGGHPGGPGGHQGGHGGHPAGPGGHPGGPGGHPGGPGGHQGGPGGHQGGHGGHLGGPGHPGGQGPPQGPPPPGNFHYNPQMMQAMSSYRHQMMYAPRQPHNQPK